MRHKGIGIAAALLAAIALLAGCGAKEDKYRPQVVPVVAKISERLKGVAAATGGAPAEVIELTTATLKDLAGLGADLQALPPGDEKQQELFAAANAYLSATQRFVTSQQDFARAYARMEASRGKVRESLDAKARTSKFSMDFWKETHERHLQDLDKVRTENEKLRDRLIAAAATAQQSADAAGAVLGKEAVIGPDVMAGHRKALDAINLNKGA